LPRPVLASLLLVTLSCSAGDDTAGDSATSAPPATLAHAVADPGGPQWPSFGHDPANTRTNVHETAIAADTVGDLRPRWELDELVGVTGTPTVVDGVAGVYRALDRDTGEIVWEATLTPGSAFGGDIGSAAFVDGTIVVASNVGDPATNAPTNVTHVFGLDAATGEQRWRSEQYDGLVFAPVSAVPGVAFVGTTDGLLLAFATASGEELWRHEVPNQVGCGPSIVDGTVLWGYGFVLFGPHGPGGLVAFGVE